MPMENLSRLPSGKIRIGWSFKMDSEFSFGKAGVIPAFFHFKIQKDLNHKD